MDHAILLAEFGEDGLRRESRLCKVFDAGSQFLNVLALCRAFDTDSDESISGRCFWEDEFGPSAGHWSWRWARRAIDTLFWKVDRRWSASLGRWVGHCELADLRDYLRANQKKRRVEERA